MFEIMREDAIRVWAYVPQDAAFGVTPGIDAIVRVPELADRRQQGAASPRGRCSKQIVLQRRRTVLQRNRERRFT